MYEKKIWDYLLFRLNNPYGAAALMGNLFAESSLNPIKANGVAKIGLTNQQYTDKVDLGEIDFVHDGIAYGLAQWRYYSRKEAFLAAAKKRSKSIGNIDIQLEYLFEELPKYKTVYNALINATSIRTASDVVLLKYEKPASTSEATKIKRAKYGQGYFDKYAKSNINISSKKNVWDEVFAVLKAELGK